MTQAPPRRETFFRRPSPLFLCLLLGSTCWIAEASAAGRIAAAKPGATREAGPSLSKTQTAEATRAYEEAVRAFNLGQWDDALSGFQLSYKISGDPTLLFNVAQTHRQAGRSKEALVAYRSYLRERPEAPNRDLVEAKIRELEALISAKTTPQPVPAFVSSPSPMPLPAPAPAPAGVKTLGPDRLAPASPPAVENRGVGQIDLTSTNQPGTDPGTGTASGYRWWLWTGVGVAAIAGVVTTVFLTTRGPSRDDTCPSGLSGCIQVGR